MVKLKAIEFLIFVTFRGFERSYRENWHFDFGENFVARHFCSSKSQSLARILLFGDWHPVSSIIIDRELKFRFCVCVMVESWSLEIGLNIFNILMSYSSLKVSVKCWFFAAKNYDLKVFLIFMQRAKEKPSKQTREPEKFAWPDIFVRGEEVSPVGIELLRAECWRGLRLQ